jgi:hypothetical protein
VPPRSRAGPPRAPASRTRRTPSRRRAGSGCAVAPRRPTRGRWRRRSTPGTTRARSRVLADTRPFETLRSEAGRRTIGRVGRRGGSALAVAVRAALGGYG